MTNVPWSLLSPWTRKLLLERQVKGLGGVCVHVCLSLCVEGSERSSYRWLNFKREHDKHKCRCTKHLESFSFYQGNVLLGFSSHKGYVRIITWSSYSDLQAQGELWKKIGGKRYCGQISKDNYYVCVDCKWWKLLDLLPELLTDQLHC